MFHLKNHIEIRAPVSELMNPQTNRHTDKHMGHQGMGIIMSVEFSLCAIIYLYISNLIIKYLCFKSVYHWQSTIDIKVGCSRHAANILIRSEIVIISYLLLNQFKTDGLHLKLSNSGKSTSVLSWRSLSFRWHYVKWKMVSYCIMEVGEGGNR